MNIVRENLPDLTTLIKVTVAPGDYEETVEKTLREYKRKANVPGFRPGMVPMGIINKMYRKGVVAEESYRAASKACFDFLEKEKVNYIGDIIPSDKQSALDFDNSAEFEFIFEAGIAPEVNIDLKGDSVDRYLIEPNQEMVEGYRANFMRRFGRLQDVDVVAKEEALTVTLDNEQMQIEEAYVGLIGMSDEERAPFIGKKAGDKMKVNVNDLYKTAQQRASVLHVKEEELGGIDPEFELTITKIRTFAEPELNEEFFRMAFPDGDVNNAKQFDSFVVTQIGKDLATHSDELFERTMRKHLIDKAGLVLPEEFLKRWLMVINEGKYSMEEIERDFPQFLEMMKWNIIQKHYFDLLDIKLTGDDMLAEAKVAALAQFAQYGMPSAPDDMLANFANSMLQDKEQARRIQERLMERKVMESLAPMVTVVEKSISPEEFGKKIEALNA